MNFTYNNHLKYYINDILYGHRTSIFDKFKVSVGPIDPEYYKSSNWLNEQLRTADILHKQYGKDLTVMFSGGTDSEIVLRAFKKIGIMPNIFFIRFKNHYNDCDYQVAREITDSLGFKLNVINFDVIKFYGDGEAWDLASKIQCRQIAYLTVYKVISEISCPSIMGGEMLLRRHTDTNGSKWYYCFRENEDASAIRFSNMYNIPLINEWFSYTPEMIAYHLQNPDIISLLTNRFNYKISSVSTKNSILKKYMPEILDKIKTHGYEKLMGFNGETYDVLYKSHVKKFEFSLDGIFVDELAKQLGIDDECYKIN